MDSAGFEFVKTNEEDENLHVNIKREPIDFLLTPDVDLKLFEAGNASDVGKSKCGEIFSINHGYFILICAFCNAEFENMRTFGMHMRNKHEGGASSSASTNTSVITNSCTAPTIKSTLQKLEYEIDNHSEIFTNLLNPDQPAVENINECNEMEVGLLDPSRTAKTEVERISDVEDNERDRNFDGGDDESYKFSSEASSQESDYEKDLKRKKDENANLKCDTCEKKYKTKKSLRRHQRATGCKQSPSDPSLYCLKCDRQLKTPATFLKHLKAHENRDKKNAGENPTLDDGSPIKVKSEPTVQDPSLFCELCNRYFKTRANLRTHAERHDTIPIALHGDADFLKCKYCDEACADFAERKKHESTHSGDRPYVCRVCQKTFSTIYKKNVHAALHTGERPHQCPECPNAYLTKRDVLRHITYRHLNVRRFKCDFCDKSCFRKTELAIHMRRHTGEKPYVCEDCGNSFAALSQLKSHQLRHTQTKNFKCDQCGRFFYSSTSLKDHQASHSDEKPFGCEVCGRRFPRAKALKKHKKLHSDVKAYICNICGKAYAQDSGLYAHKKSHGLFSNPQGTQFTVPLP